VQREGMKGVLSTQGIAASITRATVSVILRIFQMSLNSSKKERYNIKKW